MKPDATNHHPDPTYLRHLIERSGLGVSGCARQLGMSRNGLQNYLSRDLGRECPYVVQYALEQLA